MQGFKQKICPECGSKQFHIFDRDKCGDCPNNGAFLPNGDDDLLHGEYIYDEAIIKEKGLVRDEAFQEGECAFGLCYDSGCNVFKCINCGHEWNLPFSDAY